MNHPKNTQASGSAHRAPGPSTVTLSRIRDPGVYVTERGDLLRIAREFMTGGRIPILMLEDRAIRLSPDPRASIAECRRLAAMAALRFNF